MKIMNYIKKLAQFSGLIGLIALPTAHAAITAAPSVSITSVEGIICYIFYGFDYLFWFLMAIATVMVLLAAFNYVTANGDSEKVSKATKMLTWAAIGIAVALIAYNVPSIVSSFFGHTGGIHADAGC